MSLIQIFLIALGLSMDNMAVAAGASCRGQKTALTQAFKMALAFAAAGIICLTAGWFGGVRLEHLIGGWDHWLAFAILCYIGAKMVKESFSESETCRPNSAFTFKTLIILALATNIDVLAVGITLGLYETSILPMLLILTAFITAATVVGFISGQKLGAKLGKRVELFGGLVLIAIGLKILFEGIYA